MNGSIFILEKVGDRMHKYAITAALEQVPASQPVVLRGDFRASALIAKEAGFEGIELHVRNPLQVDGISMRAVADSLKLGFAGIATGMEYTRNGLCLIDTDSEKRLAAVKRLEEHIDLAGTLDCPVIIGIMRGNLPDVEKYGFYEELLIDSLLRLSEYAGKKNVRLVFEAITRYINNYLNTVQETYDFLNKIGKPNLTIHIDTHSMNIEDKSNAASVRYCGGNIGFVHFSDSNRLRPGLGHVNFKEMLDVLDEAGYNDYISIECIPTPDSRACAFECMDYLRDIEKR